MIKIEVVHRPSNAVVESHEFSHLGTALGYMDTLARRAPEKYGPTGDHFVRKTETAEVSNQDLRFGRFSCGCVGFTNKDQTKCIVVEHCSENVDSGNVGPSKFIDYSDRHFDTAEERTLMHHWHEIKMLIVAGHKFRKLQDILKFP